MTQEKKQQSGKSCFIHFWMKHLSCSRKQSAPDSRHQLDRRESTRRKFYQGGSYLVTNPFDNSIPDNCFIRNISEKGLLIELSENNIKIDSEILLIYTIDSKPRRDRLKVKHVTRRNYNWQYGCIFRNNNATRDHQKIRDK